MRNEPHQYWIPTGDAVRKLTASYDIFNCTFEMKMELAILKMKKNLIRRVHYLLVACLFSLACVWSVPAAADTVYQTPESFIAEAFGTPPAPAFLWLTAEVQASIRPLLGHPYPQARLRYWRVGDTTAWVLEETGKEYPITAGFLVQNGQILQARLLVYREARGGEIHLSSFLRQFAGAGIDASGALTRPIDGITGATLSVDAMRRMARTALSLSRRIPL